MSVDVRDIDVAFFLGFLCGALSLCIILVLASWVGVL